MQYEYVNLTGHEVHELRANLKIPAGKRPYRVKTITKTIADPIDGSPMDYDGATVEIVDIVASDTLPKPKQGVIYIVSQLALNAVPEGRLDVVAPKQVVRYKDGPNKGEVKGCIGFRTKG